MIHINIGELIHQYGYNVIFLIFFLETLGIPLPVGTTLMIAGVAWSSGTLSFAPLLISSVLANMMGATTAYTMKGREASLLGLSDLSGKLAEDGQLFHFWNWPFNEERQYLIFGISGNPVNHIDL